jgi:hypothetical protein
MSGRIGALALVAALLGLAAPAAAQDPVGFDPPFTWTGVNAAGANQTYDAQAGTPCGNGLANRCDARHLRVDNPTPADIQVAIAPSAGATGSVDFDLFVYASDAAGARGRLLGSSATASGAEATTIHNASGFLLVQVVYFDVTGASYDGRASLVRRDPFPRDLDDPAGLQDALASDPGLGFRSHSEPHVAQSPLDPNLLVAASKMYNRDPDSLLEYEFKIGTYVSFDRGATWRDLG